MSAYHCVACPLIFQSRNEVEWHLRNDHRSASDELRQWDSETEAAAQPLTWVRLRSLQAAVSDPSISILLPTRPAPAMTGLDLACLSFLASRATRRLRRQASGPRLALLESRLQRLIATRFAAVS